MYKFARRRHLLRREIVPLIDGLFLFGSDQNHVLSHVNPDTMTTAETESLENTLPSRSDGAADRSRGGSHRSLLRAADIHDASAVRWKEPDVKSFAPKLFRSHDHTFCH